MNLISTANIPMNHGFAVNPAKCVKQRLAAFLTADDDWIARNQGKTIAFLLTAAMVVPGVIEWMI